MNCPEVRQSLISYLNGEVAPSEQMNIQTHLNICTACQNEAERINALQGQLIQSLHRRADLVAPTPAAWNQFRAKLAANYRMKKKEPKLMRKLAFTTLIVLLVVLVTVAFVPSVQAQVKNVIRRIVYGKYSVIEQIETQEFPEQRPLPDDMWSVDTDIGGWGGNTPPGMAPIVKSVATLGNAQALVSISIQTPTKLPDGYRLREVKISPVGSVFLFYGGPGKAITVIESPVGPGPDRGFVQSETGSYSVVVNGKVEEVDFDGRKAVWTPDLHSLMWEAGGINFTVGGLDLNLDQTMEIARSLR